mmetsp:Transcript_19725/g.24335  ORF Transcript_19725/g.24335 Transcript_19725/m.24335 type:complete len:130 (+) Transcript_19725:792-1181(+)|eukprot:CAMPEP_0170469004 /NCGR_PEP_ID=MMETSP0123-20130129/11977_1 /TAXON_ID=182087 /ORGANISM="Favella ehrenbergii, Strain Fehren 1" /LENGTH=129 /DNA_ID=CAMNT_0010735725 /DNA_START=264 /DNA_END=653 /DNA_ORIENTATION=-
MHEDINDRVSKFKEEFAGMQRQNEKTMLEHKMRLGSNSETIVKHREMIDENKHMLSASQDLISKISSKLTETKSEFLNKIDFTHQELNQQAELNHKWAVEQVEIIGKSLSSDKSEMRNEIDIKTADFRK